MTAATTWGEFARAASALAEAGRALLYQYGTGLGYLATVSRDGAPRIHPVCPILTDDRLFVFVVPSPKRDDLHRDGRYALHAFAAVETDDEFVVTGIARPVDDPAARAAAKAAWGKPVPDDHELFELLVERARHAKYKGHGDWPPVYTRWREAPAREAVEEPGTR